MQIIVIIPSGEELHRYGGAEKALLRDVSGVPLLVRVLATGTRAGADCALILHRDPLSSEIQQALHSSKLLNGLRRLEYLEVPQFDPTSAKSWLDVSEALENQFLWLPWNWVTNKHGLNALQLVHERVGTWDGPARLSRAAVLSADNPKPQLALIADGVAVSMPNSVPAAERWLVAHSGKPLDGIYSTFNRRLCRPLVRMLAHTPVTPNMVTVAGLAVGIVSAYFFAYGTYLASVAGALLFFLSGLLDEVDGMLARVRFAESAFGTWFEGSVDNLSYLLLFTGVTIGLYHQRGAQEVLLGELAVIGAILSIAVISWQRGRLTDAKRPNEYCGRMYQLMEKDRGNRISQMARRIEFLLKKGVFIHYVVLFTVLGILPVMLRLAVFASNLTWVVALYLSFRFLRRRQLAVAAIGFSKAA